MQQVWRKRWKATGWIALGATTLVLIVCAVNRKDHKVCTGIEVAFNGDGNNFFVDEKGVVAILKSYGTIKGQPINAIDLKALEARLKKDTWIAQAELYFNNQQQLQVTVKEKEPVARIFTVGGSSFYIDSSCRRLPLSDKLSARIPMFTGFPSDKLKLSKPDSGLLASVKELAMFIQADDFWKAQVAQIDISPDGFEMIPTVGSHVVELGKDGGWQQKFDRLFSFYKQVWTKVGFEKYEKLDVQFDGQVVATIKGAKTDFADSAKARIAYQNIVAEVKSAASDSVPAGERAAGLKDTVRVRGSSVSSYKDIPDNATGKKILWQTANISKATGRQPADAVVDMEAKSVEEDGRTNTTQKGKSLTEEALTSNMQPEKNDDKSYNKTYKKLKNVLRYK